MIEKLKDIFKEDDYRYILENIIHEKEGIYIFSYSDKFCFGKFSYSSKYLTLKENVSILNTCSRYILEETKDEKNNNLCRNEKNNLSAISSCTIGILNLLYSYKKIGIFKSIKKIKFNDIKRQKFIYEFLNAKLVKTFFDYEIVLNYSKLELFGKILYTDEKFNYSRKFLNEIIKFIKNLNLSLKEIKDLYDIENEDIYLFDDIDLLIYGVSFNKNLFNMLLKFIQKNTILKGLESEFDKMLEFEEIKLNKDEVILEVKSNKNEVIIKGNNIIKKLDLSEDINKNGIIFYRNFNDLQIKNELYKIDELLEKDINLKNGIVLLYTRTFQYVLA